VTVSDQVTSNTEGDVAVPPGVVTTMYPDVAVAGTVTSIVVLDSSKIVPATPLKVTDVASANWRPTSSTVAPGAAFLGLDPAMAGWLGVGILDNEEPLNVSARVPTPV
jgi:hypothetical protein